MLQQVSLTAAIYATDANGNPAAEPIATTTDIAISSTSTSTSTSTSIYGKLVAQVVASALTVGSSYVVAVSAVASPGTYRARLSGITVQWLML